MPIIYTYPSATPSAADLLIFSDVSATDPAKDTRKCTIQDIVTLVGALVPGGGTVTSVGLSGGTTGLAIADTGENPIITSGTFTLDGTLNVSTGGTGVKTLTGVLHGNGTAAFTASAVDLATEVDGLLAEQFGGTGAFTYNKGDILYCNTTGANLTKLTIGAHGTILTVATDIPAWTTAGTAGLVTSVDVSGGITGLVFTGGPITTTGTITLASGQLIVANGGTGAATHTSGDFLKGAGTAAITSQQYIDLTTDVTGILPVTNGGTGAATFTDGGILLGSGTGAITPTASMTNGQLLIGSTGVDPVLNTLTAGTGITINNTAGAIEIVASASGGNGIYGGSGLLTAGPTTVDMDTNDLTWTGEHDTRILYDKVPRTSLVNTTFVVEVHQASDIPATLAANTTYIIRGEVSISTQITVTNQGCSIIGIDRNRDKLIWNAEGPMLVVTDVDFDLENIWLSSTLTGSVLIEATNFVDGGYNDGRNKVLTITNCQIRNCFDIASIEGFDLVDINNTLFFYVEAPNFGLKFLNTSKIEISSCELIRWFDETSLPTPSGYATASMIEILANGEVEVGGIGAINISGNIIHPQQTQVGVNINTGSTTGFGTIAANTFVNVGLTTGEVFLGDALTPANGAYSETECLKYDIFSNQGLPNSTAYILADYNGNATATTLVAAPTFTAINTGGLNSATNSQRWTTTASGVFTYNGTKNIYTSFICNISFEKVGGGNDDYEYAFFKNGSIVATSQTIRNADRKETFVMLFADSIVNGDTFDIRVRNNDDPLVNILILGWHCIIKE